MEIIARLPRVSASSDFSQRQGSEKNLGGWCPALKGKDHPKERAVIGYTNYPAWMSVGKTSTS
jgi:hypothetical protein